MHLSTAVLAVVYDLQKNCENVLTYVFSVLQNSAVLMLEGLQCDISDEKVISQSKDTCHISCPCALV